jgi:hypothetical protein
MSCIIYFRNHGLVSKATIKDSEVQGWMGLLTMFLIKRSSDLHHSENRENLHLDSWIQRDGSYGLKCSGIGCLIFWFIHAFCFCGGFHQDRNYRPTDRICVDHGAAEEHCYMYDRPTSMLIDYMLNPNKSTVGILGSTVQHAHFDMYGCMIILICTCSISR